MKFFARLTSFAVAGLLSAQTLAAPFERRGIVAGLDNLLNGLNFGALGLGFNGLNLNALNGLNLNLNGLNLRNLDLAALQLNGLNLNGLNFNGNFNQFGGFGSLNGFDDFFGVDNFNGLFNAQVLLPGQNVVCQAQNINLVQQQLAIVQELTKRILLEQVCDVEAQQILLQQLLGGFNVFGGDLLHLNAGRAVGFDANIAALAAQLLNAQNQLNIVDFGFLGRNVGRNFVVPSGSNWVDASSPQSVLAAQVAAQAANAATNNNANSTSANASNGGVEGRSA